MGSSPIDALMAWLQRLGSSLSPRLLHVVQAIRALDRATTMGAVAGFALAILIAWRFSRPRAPRSARPPHARSPPPPSAAAARKRDEAGPSGTAGAGGRGAGEVARATGASAGISQAQQRGAGRSAGGGAFAEAEGNGGTRDGLRKDLVRQEDMPQSRLALTVRQQLNGSKRVSAGG
ncbi:unnamed protein product [Closterium sp. NIES-54]